MYDHKSATSALLDLLRAADVLDLSGLMIVPADGSVGVQWPEAWAGMTCATPIHAQDLGLVLQCLRDARCCWKDVYAARRSRREVPHAWLEREYGGDLLAAECEMLRDAPNFNASAWTWGALVAAVKSAAPGWTWSEFQSLNGHHLSGRLASEIGLIVSLQANGRLGAAVYCECCEDDDLCSSVNLGYWMADADLGLLTPRNINGLHDWVRGGALKLAQAHRETDDHKFEAGEVSK